MLIRRIVKEDAIGRTVQILELPGFERPEKSHQPDQAQEQSRRYQHQEVSQVFPPRPRRSALAITSNEEVDMAMAAIKGVT